MLKGPYDISLSLAGDLLIARNIPHAKGWGTMEPLYKLQQSHDCCFGNLETTVIENGEGYPALFPGGGYAMTSRSCLHNLAEFGFNLLNTATNHAMDYSHNGLLKTIDNLKKENISFAGTGKNLSEAAAATFFECPNGRVAMLGVTSSFHDSYAAGPQNQDMIGRPGVAPLKHNTIYELDKKNFDDLSRIATITGINNYHNQSRKEGYLLQEENFKFGSFNFKCSEANVTHTYPNQNDLGRTIKIIKDAKIQADLVIVSVHSHQFKNTDKKLAPEFIEIFCHECANAGANIIVCHGPHLIRGIEVYKGVPIFFGLGNFIFQHEQQKILPEDFYQKYGLSRQTCTGVGEAFVSRSNNGQKGLIASTDEWKSIFVSICCNNKLTKINLYPIEISKVTGLPSLSQDESILQELKLLSEPYSTQIHIENGVGFININKDLA